MKSLLQTFIITFDSNGGSEVPPPQTLFKNEKIALPRTPTKQGFLFGGWFTDDFSFENGWDFDDTPEGDMTLYAAWSNKPTLTKNNFIIKGAEHVKYDGNPKVVTVTPLRGISVGKITVFYVDSENTTNEKTSIAPINPGSYIVTFNVAAAEVWTEANDLYAGTLIIETPYINDANELRNLLKKLSSSTAAGENGISPTNPITIPLNIYNNYELYDIADVLKSAPSIFVTLDLTGSDISYIPEMAFTSYSGNSLPAEDNDPAHYNGCKTLIGIILPDNIYSIGVAAFANCTNLKNVNIRGYLYEIEAGAFAWCKSLNNINIPDYVERIGRAAFYNCTDLTLVNIPYGVYIIEGSVFEGCSSLNNITIPYSVYIIEESAFEGCSSLNNITIPFYVNSIGSHAFSGCTSLTIVTINATIDENKFSTSAFGTPNETAGYIGDLREKYFETGTSANSNAGGPGTYTRPDSSSKTWTKVN